MRARTRLLPPLLVAAVALPLAIATPRADGTVREQLDDAQERQARLDRVLAETTGDLEFREEQLEEIEQELTDLDAQDAALVEQLADVEDALALRARRAYMAGGGTVLSAVLSGDGPGAAVERAALLEALALRDVGTVEEASALRTSREQVRELRLARADELARLRQELEADLVLLNEELEAAAADVRFLDLLSRRQRELDLSFARGLYSCPVGDPLTFRDTWGDRRSGGRSHKGVDLFAPHGTPVHAIHAGTITRLSNSGLGGISVYMFGDDGNEYYYTHLQGYAAGVSVGQRVVAGDLIAYNGSTGNADYWAPHVHFQVHPGAGSPVNPYPYAAAACGRWTPGQDARGAPPPPARG